MPWILHPLAWLACQHTSETCERAIETSYGGVDSRFPAVKSFFDLSVNDVIEELNVVELTVAGTAGFVLSCDCLQQRSR